MISVKRLATFSEVDELETAHNNMKVYADKLLDENGDLKERNDSVPRFNDTRRRKQTFVCKSKDTGPTWP